MSAERTLTPEILELITRQVVVPVLFIYAEFPDNPRAVWTGGGPVNLLGKDWTGVGGIVSIDGITETTDTAAKGMKINLDGLNQTLVNELRSSQYQGKPVWMRQGFYDETETPYGIYMVPGYFWKGVLDTSERITGRESIKLTFFCEHRMVDILRKREHRYTDKDQKALWPGRVDTALTRMDAIQDLSIAWGRQQKEE